MAALGLWNIGGYNLPDFKITENLGLTGMNNPAVAPNATGLSSGAVFNQSSQPVSTAPFGTTPQNLNLNQPGLSTYVAPTNNNNGGGGGGDGSNLSLREQMEKGLIPWDDNKLNSGGGVDQSAVLNGINSAWGNYENQLNAMLNTDLPNQQAAQNTMAQNAFNQGVNTLDAQKLQSTEELTNQQNKNLKDLGSNVRNLFQSGNQYLGSRGAGDSTAANQYAYAIGKMGTQARGDIMSQVSTQMQNIGNIYNSEKNRLQSELTNKVAEISQWFSSAQSQLRQQLAQAGISKSQDIQNYSQQLVNQALSQLQYAQQQVDARRSTLETWAANNSTNVQQMAQKMQELQSIPQFQGLFPNTSTSGGGGAVATLFGNAGKKTTENQY